MARSAKRWNSAPKIDRGTTTERGYGHDWHKFRRWFLSEHPVCEDCPGKGQTRAATEVHHKQKVVTHPHLRLKESNCMALCKICHSIRTMNGE